MTRQSLFFRIALPTILLCASVTWAGTDTLQTTAAQFELKDLEGKVHRLTDYLESGSVCLWFTNFCEGCQSSMPQLKAAFSGEKTPLLIVSLLGEDRQTPARIKTKLELAFPILLDPEGEVTKLYSGAYMPKTCPLENFYAIKKGGDIVYNGHYPGLDPDELANLIAKMK